MAVGFSFCSGFLMGVVASNACCGEGGFWLFLFGKREIHRNMRNYKVLMVDK